MEKKYDYPKETKGALLALIGKIDSNVVMQRIPMTAEQKKERDELEARYKLLEKQEASTVVDRVLKKTP